MTSILKADTIQDTDGNNIINENSNAVTIGKAADTVSIPGNATLGASGKTITIPSGCTITNNGTQTGFGGVNTPCFRASISNGTSLADNTSVKVEFGNEGFDVGGCYNNTSSTVTLNGISVPSYSFAPNVAGKYFVAAAIRMDGDTDFDIFDCQFSGIDNSRFAVVNRRYNSNSVCTVVEFNGTSDSICVQGYQVSGGTKNLYNSARDTWFLAYKIIE